MKKIVSESLVIWLLALALLAVGIQKVGAPVDVAQAATTPATSINNCVAHDVAGNEEVDVSWDYLAPDPSVSSLLTGTASFEWNATLTCDTRVVSWAWPSGAPGASFTWRRVKGVTEESPTGR